MRLRTGIRALVLDPDERIALVRFDFPDRTVWAAPGGGVEEGEDDAATGCPLLPWRRLVHTARMRVAALLRGINIGPNKRIAMADLRAIVESLGHTDVETYLQSGNVVFTPKRRAKDIAASLSAAIREATGHDVPVVVRTGAELARVVEANPYTVDDPTKVVVAFLADAVDLGDLALGDLSSYLPTS